MTSLNKDLSSWINKRRGYKRQGRSIGFVPTMGALHAGHLSLLERSRKENDLTVLSIYVNPTQFDNKEDLKNYPNTLDRDCELARTAGVDEILVPTFEQLYPDNYTYQISETKFSNTLCGAHRPGHFNGVLTVVMKLLQIVQAERSYFGEKDFQQLKLIEGMVAAFFLETTIVACPTVREKDGLAMSSRNVNLNASNRATAPNFHEILRGARSTNEARSQLVDLGFEVEYIEDLSLSGGLRRFGAVKLGGVRLIDNVQR